MDIGMLISLYAGKKDFYPLINLVYPESDFVVESNGYFYGGEENLPSPL
jgi:hypothetical protein